MVEFIAKYWLEVLFGLVLGLIAWGGKKLIYFYVKEMKGLLATTENNILTKLEFILPSKLKINPYIKSIYEIDPNSFIEEERYSISKYLTIILSLYFLKKESPSRIIGNSSL